MGLAEEADAILRRRAAVAAARAEEKARVLAAKQAERQQVLADAAELVALLLSLKIPTVALHRREGLLRLVPVVHGWVIRCFLPAQAGFRTKGYNPSGGYEGTAYVPPEEHPPIPARPGLVIDTDGHFREFSGKARRYLLLAGPVKTLPRHDTMLTLFMRLRSEGEFVPYVMESPRRRSR